jgi:hypothetical protein
MEVNSTNDNKSRHESCELDRRYGEIGISAVAAAVRCRSEERTTTRSRRQPHESD